MPGLEGPDNPPPPPPTGDGGNAPTSPRPTNCEARAAAAEARADELARELDGLRADLDSARKGIADADRAAVLQRLLIEARAVDLDAATLLAQRAVAGIDAPDLAGAVRELRRRKPHLFRTAPTSTSMSPRLAPNPNAAADELADIAASTGDRRALLRYLRARRRQ